MVRKLIEDYCKEVLGVKQEILSYEVKGNEVYIVFMYDEDYMYQENESVSLLDIVSFVYSRV